VLPATSPTPTCGPTARCQRTRSAGSSSRSSTSRTQLIEHWQDVAEDRRAGRVYLPQEDLAAFGVAESELDEPTTSAALRKLMLFEIDRAADLLDTGAPLVWLLPGWARLAVSSFIAGGRATVDALRRTGGDVLTATARPRGADVLRHIGILQFGKPKKGDRQQ
jgi:phytoene/squalene synthetase